MGYYADAGGKKRVLAEGWNGGRWRIKPVGSGAPLGELSSVSCPGRRYCMAVGYIGDKHGVAVWNGTRWSVQRATHLAPIGADDVSCTSATSCTTIGHLDSTVRAHHWNGKRWSMHSIGYFYNPSPGGLACAGPTFCMSVGAFQDSSDTAGTWTEQRSATGWHSPGGDGDDGQDIPSAISCPSPTACVAVGQWSFQGLVYSSGPMAWSWNGTRWTDISPSPPP